MTNKKLQHILAAQQVDGSRLRWITVVPIATNPFLLLELFQFALIGGAVVLTTLCVGIWLTEGALTPADIRISLYASGMTLLAAMAGFIGLAFFFFGNRYFAVFQVDSAGIYYECSWAQDEDRRLFLFSVRPVPVRGQVQTKRTRSRQLPLGKVTHFEDFPALRVIILRRRFWHMLKLYTPDADTHQQVAQYFGERLIKV